MILEVGGSKKSITRQKDTAVCSKHELVFFEIKLLRATGYPKGGAIGPEVLEVRLQATGYSCYPRGYVTGLEESEVRPHIYVGN